jgi:hypothetical protein
MNKVFEINGETTMNYRLDFFSRSGERDFCRCDELAMLRSFDLSRSRDDF